MKKIFKLTLFKKIFLIIFIGFFIVESIYLYMNYENNCRLIANDYINNEVLKKLENVRDYIVMNSCNPTSQEMIQYVQKTLGELNGYYVAIDNKGKVLTEELQNVNFSDNPYMILVSDGSENGDYMTMRVNLKNISTEIIKDIETYLHSQSHDHVFTVQTMGEKKEIVNEETQETYFVIEPNFLKIDEKVLVGNPQGNMIGYRLHIFSSKDVFYRDLYNNEDGYSLEFSQNELTNLSRDFARKLYNNIRSYGEISVGYEKQENNLLLSQSLYLEPQNEGESGVFVVWVDYYATVFTNVLLQVIHDNFRVYMFSIFLSFFMSFGISYMVTKRIKRIDKSAKKIANNDFDIFLNENSQDELGTLSHSINHMSQQLKNNIEHLNKEIEHVKHLESVRKEFIANFTHEIKTPLGIINGYIELIESTVDETKKEQYLEAINQETDRINELVLAMLNLSKLESGHVILKLEDLDLEDLITSTIDHFASVLEKKKIKISIEGNYPEIQADLFEMQMVLKNFISNAIKHTPNSGNIHIVYEDNVLSIENEGEHITDKQKERIWDTYVSGDREGTGLGLAICKTILDLHGYGYSVENTQSGVKFNIYYK